MLSRSYLSSKLSSLLFLNINKNILAKLFNCSLGDNLYLPLKANEIINEVKSENPLEEIPIKFFVEGMYYVIGCDNDFKHSEEYKNLLTINEWCSKLVKGIIAAYIKESNYLDGYILLRGLYITSPQVDIFEKMLWCLQCEFKKDKKLGDELKNLIEYGKTMKYPYAYLCESQLLYEDGKYADAKDSLNLFFSFGGESSEEILNFSNELRKLSDLEIGRENIRSNPKYALELLLPLLEHLEEDAYLYYYIAVAYRNLGLSPKAIYYLNECMRLDNTIVDVFNELGLNYACLGDYDTAIAYFRKVFEATRSVELCTNLIMCYFNKGDIDAAHAHLEIAKKIDGDDEILKSIEKMLRGNITNDGD
ncbi:tetratricopeptide repeat protein [Clostridium thermarum]|uniref:tetratricopeptide repeat protein n=1 Tax=Clostridium thermarum TaxID=1716543 RepID=UPI00111D364E|nr:tetratricopeptide repeat protein [Clostridium thermarum]